MSSIVRSFGSFASDGGYLGDRLRLRVDCLSI